ncbi:MAG: molybdopterin-guanine dinucleotide biosynthesis protein B [Candidatus Heimdallarchaeota archaeon]|nr:molybdopterin-guanine dinucleotide biosynthesis protein B [Candidatus Heimdallarchaeota archaeon]
MKIFSVIGYTNSGKTGTIIEVIKELVKRGFIVNSIKQVHIENFSIDTEGKDSWKHKEAGSSVIGIRGDNETTLIYPKSMNVKDLVIHLDADFLALEGFSSEKFIPKILCAKNIEDLEEKLDESVFVISGVISNEFKEYKKIPVINGLTDISSLVDLVEKKAIDLNFLLENF